MKFSKTQHTFQGEPHGATRPHHFVYDQSPVYTAVEGHSPGTRVIIPPRKNAVLSPTAGTYPRQRDEHLAAIERDGVLAWKRTLGYYAQSHAENAFARFKRILEAQCVRSGRHLTRERPRLSAICSIGCANWVGRSLIQSAKTGG